MIKTLSLCITTLLLASCLPASPHATSAGDDGTDWPNFGQNAEELHFSPLTQIDAGSVGQLGLAWSYDLPPGNPMSSPVQVGGVLYTSTGYSVVRAFEAATGKLLWTWDPQVPEASGRKLRQGWGSKGLTWWDDKLYVATHDGRLVALDAKTGKPVWSTLTVGKDDYRFVDGVPRVLNGMVIIGHGGADASDMRAYVTAYDARTGKQVWRFHIVPGDPAKGFESEAMAMAAKTWSGEWWKYGGGGAAWNAFSYDPETDTVYVGTGNGAPWNHKIRSEGKGDNLFLCSIVALDAKTGKYKWHYQVNPGESWDYNAAMDMHLADITIGGKLRKVLIQAPKNGFLYVIDRISGKLISADAITPVTWATGIDLASGRPIENPAVRYPNGSTAELIPGPSGAHTWLPSAVNPTTGLVYIPVLKMGATLHDKGIDPKNWKREKGNVTDGAANLGLGLNSEGKLASGELLAWDIAARKAVWRAEVTGGWSGGVLATGGNLVFQGQDNGIFTAYDAATGKPLWRFDAEAPVLAPPISYSVNGKQYVTVIAGISTSAGIIADSLSRPVDYRTQERRILTFAIDAKRKLPRSPGITIEAPADPDYRPDPAVEMRGAKQFARCYICHGYGAVAGGSAPDLRASAVPLDPNAFAAVVRDGALLPSGMPRYEELTDAELADLRQYIRSAADAWRKSPSKGVAVIRKGPTN